jgi:hypothetical protein
MSTNSNSRQNGTNQAKDKTSEEGFEQHHIAKRQRHEPQLKRKAGTPEEELGGQPAAKRQRQATTPSAIHRDKATFSGFGESLLEAKYSH